MTSKNEKTTKAQAEVVSSRPADSAARKGSGLWWRHRFYQSQWKEWYAKWLELVRKTPVENEGGPAKVLAWLQKMQCDPDVALRLAFLEVSHKPAAQSELAKDTRRQQRIRRKLHQAGNRLWDGAQILDGAMRDAPLIFLKPETIDALREVAINCAHELEVLLWVHSPELPPGHELFTLAAYVNACSGNPNYALLTDLLSVVYEAHGRRAPTQDAITKQVQRFRKPDSMLHEVIEDDTSRRAKSGELKEDLLACFPAGTLP
jgi:hypothetical protein